MLSDNKKDITIGDKSTSPALRPKNCILITPDKKKYFTTSVNNLRKNSLLNDDSTATNLKIQYYNNLNTTNTDASLLQPNNISVLQQRILTSFRDICANSNNLDRTLTPKNSSHIQFNQKDELVNQHCLTEFADNSIDKKLTQSIDGTKNTVMKININTISSDRILNEENDISIDHNLHDRRVKFVISDKNVCPIPDIQTKATHLDSHLRTFGQHSNIVSINNLTKQVDDNTVMGLNKSIDDFQNFVIAERRKALFYSIAEMAEIRLPNSQRDISGTTSVKSVNTHNKNTKKRACKTLNIITNKILKDKDKGKMLPFEQLKSEITEGAAQLMENMLSTKKIILCQRQTNILGKEIRQIKYESD